MDIKKTYSSLTQFKQELEKEGIEKILEFNGAFLITKRGNKKIVYGLYKGVISSTVYD
jgi:hypothetical protein